MTTTLFIAQLLLSPIFFYLFTNKFKDLKRKLKLSMYDLDESNPIKFWLIYLLNCVKCSSFQITFLINIFFQPFLLAFLLAATISFITINLEGLMLELRMMNLEKEIKRRLNK